MADGAVEQIVGRARRQRVSQLPWCGGRCFETRRRVNSDVRHLLLTYGSKLRLKGMGRQLPTGDISRRKFAATLQRFHKGTRKSASRTWDTSGITVVVSEADGFAGQVTDAIEFLKSNGMELQQLQGSVGLGGLSLDFGVDRKNGFLQSHLFPAELVSLAAEYSMALEVSIYGS